MKITDELIQEIEEMEKLNIPEEKIKKYLNLKGSVAETKEEFHKFDGYLKVSDAVELLKPHLGTLKDDKAYELKILRLIKGKKDEKPLLKATKLSNKLGYRIKKEDIETFITNSKKTKEQLLQELQDVEDWKGKAEDWETKAVSWEAVALKYKALYEESIGKKSPEVIEDVPEGQMAIEDVEVEVVNENENTGQSEPSDVKKLTVGVINSITVLEESENKALCTVEFKMNGEKTLVEATLEDGVWELSERYLNDYPIKEIEKKLIPKLKKEWKSGKKVN